MIRRLCVSCLAFFRHWNKEWRTAWLLLLLLLLDPSVAACLCVLILFCFATQLEQQKQQQTDKGNRSGNTLHPAPGTWHLKPKTIYHLRTRPYDIDYNILQTQGHPLHYTTLHIHTPHFVHSIECILSFRFSFVSLSIYFPIFWFSDFLISWFPDLSLA